MVRFTALAVLVLSAAILLSLTLLAEAASLSPGDILVVEEDGGFVRHFVRDLYWDRSQPHCGQAGYKNRP